MARSIISCFDISSYAPPPHAEIIAQEVSFIAGHLPILTASDIDAFIKHRAPDSPLTGQMFIDAANQYRISNDGLRLMLALCQQDTMYGTKGEGARLHNAGNVGDDDEGHTRDYGAWEAGVDAVASWLDRHRVIESDLFRCKQASEP